MYEEQKGGTINNRWYVSGYICFYDVCTYCRI